MKNQKEEFLNQDRIVEQENEWQQEESDTILQY